MNKTVVLSRIVLISADPTKLARFYVDTFGFVISGTTDLVEPLKLMLGAQTIEIAAQQSGGAAYPTGTKSSDPIFQHFAMAVADMQQAYESLCAQSGWSPISTAGPQRLPASSGGVTAFKFRDPEGHPLELIAFPMQPADSSFETQAALAPQDEGIDCTNPHPKDKIALRIDHSAIVVADTAISITFYKTFGFKVAGTSLNRGIEQAHLDAVADPIVKVTSLAVPGQMPPHLELLCYRGLTPAEAIKRSPDDIAATRLVLTLDDEAAFGDLCKQHSAAIIDGSLPRNDLGRSVLLRDPDGHLIQLELHPPVAKPG